MSFNRRKTDVTRLSKLYEKCCEFATFCINSKFTKCCALKGWSYGSSFRFNYIAPITSMKDRTHSSKIEIQKYTIFVGKRLLLNEQFTTSLTRMLNGKHSRMVVKMLWLIKNISFVYLFYFFRGMCNLFINCSKPSNENFKTRGISYLSFL